MGASWVGVSFLNQIIETKSTVVRKWNGVEKIFADRNTIFGFRSFTTDHSIFLPMILVEMELGDASMLGALDLLTLVLVCSGICLGILLTGNEEERNLAKRGMTINLCYGDFIEACYPHMERHRLVNISGYLASSLSAAMLTGTCKSSAYLPLPIAIWLAEDRETFMVATILSFSIPFVATILNYFFFIRNTKTD